MLMIKRRLTRGEIAANLARAKKMRAAGVDIPIREDWLESAHWLDIMVGEDFLPMAFDMPGGYGGYAFGLRMVSRRSGTLRECSLATDWDDFIVPGSFDDREAFCWLGHLPIPRRQVLNERIMNSLKFHGCGHMVEGVILAHGSKPIPEAYRHGQIVPFTMTFLDQWGNEIRHDGKLYVDRTWEAKYVRPGRRPVSSLREPMPSDPDFRPNLNCGPVRDTTAEMLKSMDRKEAEPESELFASLKRALSQLRQQAAAEAGKQPKKPGDKVDQASGLTGQSPRPATGPGDEEGN